MPVRSLFLVILSAIILSASMDACADDDSVMKKISELESRVKALEAKLADQGTQIQQQKACIADQDQKIAQYQARFSDFDEELHRQKGLPEEIAEGLSIGAGITTIVQGTNNTNATDEKKQDRVDGSYSADITIEKEFKELSGRAFLHLEAGQGEGLQDELALYSNVNRDADNDNNVRISEAWYEQELFGNKAAVTFGKLDPTAYFDNNELANDETTQFLSSIFRNNLTVEFPDNTIGARAAVLPFEWLELSYGILDANSDWEKIFDNLFHMGQVAFKAKLFGQEGNYRFFAWSNNSYHTKWLDPAKEKEEAYGLGLSFDQRVMECLSVFARYGWQNPRVYNPDIMAAGDFNYSLEHSWSAGLQVEGKPWGRQDDVFGIAVGQAIPSNDYKKAGADLDPARRAKNEGHIEAYYNIRLNQHLSVTPDFQYIWDPFGKDVVDDTDGIFVYGLRAQIDF